MYIPKNGLDLEIDNNVKSLRVLLGKLKKIYKSKYQNLVFVYEPTGSYSERLRQFCVSKDIQSFILNPKRSSSFAKSNGNRSKSDKIDVRLLSDAIVLAKAGEIQIPVIDATVESIKGTSQN